MNGPFPASPLLSGVVVHWYAEDSLAQLVDAWPLRDPRFELLVVDNGSRRPLELPSGVQLLTEHRNLGFAGGMNLGVARARAPLVLLLNPDARPRPGALEEILRGFRLHPRAAGLAPRLLGPRGEIQFRWQLRPLPSPWQLVLQTLLLPGVQGPAKEPAEAKAVDQPAAAALAMRREVFLAVDGLDETFYPAWFEDVDLAKRLNHRGHRLLYWPKAHFQHQLGSSLPSLGYGPFLWIYYRNLCRYLAKHHGRAWAWGGRVSLAFGMLLRLALVPLRCPSRAASRREAALGLIWAARGAVGGWRSFPRGLPSKLAFPVSGLATGPFESPGEPP